MPGILQQVAVATSMESVRTFVPKALQMKTEILMTKPHFGAATLLERELIIFIHGIRQFVGVGLPAFRIVDAVPSARKPPEPAVKLVVSAETDNKSGIVDPFAKVG